jgi:RHS repeat-associated protein
MLRNGHPVRNDTGGQRIAKIVIPRTAAGPKPQSEWTYTIYVRDAQGNTMATYSRFFETCGEIDWRDKLQLDEQYIYGSARVGMLNRVAYVSKCFNTTGAQALEDGYTTFIDPSYVGSTLVFSTEMSTNDSQPYENSVIFVSRKTYEFTDHLGNVSATISDRKITIAVMAGNAVASYTPEVLSEQDYFPFGMGMMGRSVTAANYKYGFNGKEDDDEWGIQDYGFRLYNPSIAKFISVDPLTKDYPWYTPYQFAGNKPIWAVDLDGLEEFCRTSYYNAAGELFRTEIQVVKGTTDIGNGAALFNSNTQLVHETVVIFNCNGGYDVYNNGVTEGVWQATGGGTSTGTGSGTSPAFSAQENAMIWNTTIATNGQIVSTFPNSLTGEIVSTFTNGGVIPIDGNAVNQGVVVINTPTTTGAPDPANSGYCPLGLTHVKAKGDRSAKDGRFNTVRKDGSELTTDCDKKGLCKADHLNQSSLKGKWVDRGNYTMPSHQIGQDQASADRRNWNAGLRRPCASNEPRNCNQAFTVTVH